MKNLSLAEELLLIALDDETGKLISIPDRALDYALAGAIVADLALSGFIRLAGNEIDIIQNDAVGEFPTEIGYDEIKAFKVKSLQGILAHLAGDGHNLRECVMNRLLEKGVLKEENKEFLWVFHVSRFPLQEKEQEEAVKERLRRRIKRSEESLPERDHILISLIHTCQLESVLFSQTEIVELSEKIETITKSDAIGRAVRECLFEIQQAIMEIRTYSGI